MLSPTTSEPLDEIKILLAPLIRDVQKLIDTDYSDEDKSPTTDSIVSYKHEEFKILQQLLRSLKKLDAGHEPFNVRADMRKIKKHLVTAFVHSCHLLLATLYPEGYATDTFDFNKTEHYKSLSEKINKKGLTSLKCQGFSTSILSIFSRKKSYEKFKSELFSTYSETGTKIQFLLKFVINYINDCIKSSRAKISTQSSGVHSEGNRFIRNNVL